MGLKSREMGKKRAKRGERGQWKRRNGVKTGEMGQEKGKNQPNGAEKGQKAKKQQNGVQRDEIGQKAI